MLANIQTNPRLFFRGDEAIAEYVELGVEGHNSWVPMIFHQFLLDETEHSISLFISWRAAFAKVFTKTNE